LIHGQSAWKTIPQMKVIAAMMPVVKASTPFDTAFSFIFAFTPDFPDGSGLDV
jgi:hypothetical protein